MQESTAVDKRKERDEQAKRLIDNNVLACQSMLVDELLKRGDIEGFDYDSIENLYTNPESWTPRECHDWLVERGIDPPDDPLDLDEAKTALDDDIGLSEWLGDVQERIPEREDHEDTDEDDIEVRLQYVEETFEFHSGSPQYDTDHRGYWGDAILTKDADVHDIAGEMIDGVIESIAQGDNPAELETLRERILDLLEDDDDTTETYQNAVRDNAEAAEIYEWWLVDDWLARQLVEIGEPVLRNDFGDWWGRTCTGQAIYLDGTIQSIIDRLGW